MRKEAIVVSLLLVAHAFGCVEPTEAESLGAPYPFPQTQGGFCASEARRFDFCEWIGSPDLAFTGTILAVEPILEPLLVEEEGQWVSIETASCREIHPGLRFRVRVEDSIGPPVEGELEFTMGGVENPAISSTIDWFADGLKFPDGTGYGRGQEISGFLHRLDDGSYSLLNENLFIFDAGRIRFSTRSACDGMPPTERDFESFSHVQSAASACSEASEGALERRRLMRLNLTGVYSSAAYCHGN